MLQVPAALLAHFAKLFCCTHGLCILMKGLASGLQMAVCVDKIILLPRPCNITQTLSPLPTKNPSVLVR